MNFIQLIYISLILLACHLVYELFIEHWLSRIFHTQKEKPAHENGTNCQTNCQIMCLNYEMPMHSFFFLRVTLDEFIQKLFASKIFIKRKKKKKEIYPLQKKKQMQHFVLNCCFENDLNQSQIVFFLILFQLTKTVALNITIGLKDPFH